MRQTCPRLAELVHVVQVLLNTNDTDDRNSLARFVHQAHVRRHLVVQRILDAKARGHRAYVLVDSDRVRAKAKALPENGIPPELVHLLPNDGSISKLQVQKAATPVDGLPHGYRGRGKGNCHTAAQCRSIGEIQQ